MQTRLLGTLARRDTSPASQSTVHTGLPQTKDKEESPIISWTGWVLPGTYPSRQISPREAVLIVDTRTGQDIRGSKPILATLDITLPYHLFTDASGVGLGAVLKVESL